MTLTGLTAAGALINTGITSDATHTDSTVCQDTTTHQFYAGSGTIGICLDTSSARYKRDWKPLAPALAQIRLLKPGTFHYINGYGDNGQRLQVGLLAEDVVKTIPTLVGLDKDGKPNSVDILGLVPLLVKAVQEQQGQIKQMRAEISRLKRRSRR
jgi:hypothetical protein